MFLSPWPCFNSLLTAKREVFKNLFSSAGGSHSAFQVVSCTCMSYDLPVPRPSPAPAPPFASRVAWVTSGRTDAMTAPRARQYDRFHLMHFLHPLLHITPWPLFSIIISNY